MKPILCRLGFHTGDVLPAHEIEQEIDGLSALVCTRCGEVVE